MSNAQGPLNPAVDPLTVWRDRALAAEAELARLREPVGEEAQKLVARLRAEAQDGGPYHLVHDAADLLERLAAQLADLYIKDRVRTNEHNILVQENRALSEQRAEAQHWRGDFQEACRQRDETQEQARRNAQDAERLSWLDRDDIAILCSYDAGPFVTIQRVNGGAVIGHGKDIRSAISMAMNYAARAAGGEHG